MLQLAWKHQFQFAGYYAALHRGYYREAGLDVKLVEGGEGRFAREEVVSGRAQYGVTGAELLLHRADGDPFVALAAIFQHSASIILSRGDSNISHPQDMIGKRLMLLPGNKDADILAIFKNEGLPIQQIERLDQTYNLNDLIEARTDAVSAYITNEPWLLEQAGVTPHILLPQTYGVDFYGDCLFTTETEIDTRPGRVNRFLEASLDGWRYAMAHQEEIIDLLINHYGVSKHREHLQYEARKMEKLIFPELVEIGHMNPGRWRHIADTFARLGEMPENYSLEGFIYDPKADVKTLKVALLTALIGFLGATLIIIFFLRMNHELKKEVNERKKIETSLRKSENRLRIIVETSQNGIMLLDSRGIIRFANQSLADMFGCSREELVGSTYPEHIHSEQRDVGDSRMKQMINGDIDAIALERHYIRADKSDFWGFLSARRHEDEQGHLISLVGIIADITEQKALENELRQAHKMESIGTLTGGIAHDFNNILMAILGNTELALEYISSENPAYTNMLTVRSSCLKAAGIVKQLLNFSRKTQQAFRSIDAVTVIDDAVNFLRSTLPAHIEIRRHLPNTKRLIQADPIQIKQMLLNIGANASQAMEETGGILDITVETAAIDGKECSLYSDLPAGDYLRVIVSDNGPGIPSDIIERVFDPYFTTKAFGEGAGMGLTVVHGIVKNHSGTITVDSRPGEGAAFTLLFPLIDRKSEVETDTRDG